MSYNLNLEDLQDNISKAVEVTLKGKDEEFDIIKIVNDTYIKPDDVIEDVDSCLRMNQPDRDVNLFTLSNFSAIIGPAKSRKTFLLTLLGGEFVSGGTGGMFRSNLKKKLLVIDTEQSRNHVIKKAKAMDSIAKSDKRFDTHTLRPYTPKQRIEIIETLLHNYGKLYDMVILDGVRDLMYDINNPTESTDVVSLLMKWTYDYNIHMAVVIHTNKEGGYARGHIGSEVMNKSETIIKVTSVGDNLSKVECEMSRDMPFADFYFGINNEGVPEVFSGDITKELDNEDF